MKTRDLGRFRNVTRQNIPRVDMHLHTSWTDGLNTVREMYDQALREGLAMVLFSEHARKNSGDWFERFVGEVRALPQGTCRVLVGVETKVADYDGSLDCHDQILKSCDLVMASVHRFPGEKGVVQGFDEVGHDRFFSATRQAHEGADADDGILALLPEFFELFGEVFQIFRQGASQFTNAHEVDRKIAESFGKFFHAGVKVLAVLNISDDMPADFFGHSGIGLALQHLYGFQDRHSSLDEQRKAFGKQDLVLDRQTQKSAIHAASSKPLQWW